MYLSNLTISNFRLFQSLDIRLNRGLNVLVGENDSGKTAFIDAVRYALGSNSSDRTYISEQDFYESSAELKIQLKFSDVESHAHRFVEHLTHEEHEEEGAKKRRAVLFVQLRAQKTAVQRRGYPYIKTEFRSGEDGNGLPVESEIRDFLATTYLKPLRDAKAELSSGRASRLSQILSSSKDIQKDMDGILTIIADANDKLLAADAPLRKSAENIQNNYLHELIFKNSRQEIGAHIDIAGIRNEDLIGLEQDGKQRHLRAILEGLSLALTEDRKLHGLGYHNLLFMGAELLLLEQSASNEFSLLLIEEPEAHLHPQLQLKLLDFINTQVANEGNKEGIQCILSTHSPNISSKVDPSEIFMLGDGRVLPLREGETELESSDYIYLRKFLDATKANIFFAKGIIFVEGDSENILLPEIARLLGRPLEDYGVSIVKYDNSGSWKRFAKLFLRKGDDDTEEKWNFTKVCVLRDLDLWPDCAEEKADNSNAYGFKKPNVRNHDYWRKNCNDESERIDHHVSGLNRQNVRVEISNDWTFEYCLAKYGLFEECCSALDVGLIDGSEEEKSTYIQSQVSKTDFAYKMAEILKGKQRQKVEEALAALDEEQQISSEVKSNTSLGAMKAYSAELKEKLPGYIVNAIEFVTAPVEGNVPPREHRND